MRALQGWRKAGDPLSLKQRQDGQPALMTRPRALAAPLSCGMLPRRACAGCACCAMVGAASSALPADGVSNSWIGPRGAPQLLWPDSIRAAISTPFNRKWRRDFCHLRSRCSCWRLPPRCGCHCALLLGPLAGTLPTVCRLTVHSVVRVPLASHQCVYHANNTSGPHICRRLQRWIVGQAAIAQTAMEPSCSQRCKPAQPELISRLQCLKPLFAPRRRSRRSLVR